MKKLKYIFVLVSFLLLLVMLLVSRDSGVNCDELLHYNQSVAVINFFATHGRDTSALDTPVTHLKYYGQSYDNITTWLTQVSGIDDIYGFRHFMSTIAGWLAIIVAAFLAIWLEGFEAGIIVVLFFSISPSFLGHAQNNLKDIPFALAYISGIYFSFRFLSTRGKGSVWDIIFLTISIAFCISIRPGGLMLICFLILFYVIRYLAIFFRERRQVLNEAGVRFLLVIFISLAACILGILLWPYALLSPVKNILDSLRVMVHYPDTFRQIFEGRAEWSDFMPWYYLLKSMVITIPVLIMGGVLLFIIFIVRACRSSKNLFYLFLLFSVLFPIFLVLVSRSNLYSSWRHFLFIYPGIVVLSAIGILFLFRQIKSKAIKYIIVVFIIVLAIHPVNYLIRNHRYAYIYYNQLVGGLKGANGNYETDYYFISQRESAEWLLKYLEQKGLNDTIVVGSNFSAEWFFRKHPLIKNHYIRFEERSMEKWDYAIITNRYIPPCQLKNHIWPPAGALHTVYADGIPISIVVERKSLSSFQGYLALGENRVDDAIQYFKEALKSDGNDDMIFYNFAVALFRKGEPNEADSALKECLRLNPDSDLALMFLGDMASIQGKSEDAKGYYEKVIISNHKYAEAYISLAKLVEGNDVMRARDLLRRCIEISPRNSRAITLLGDTYRESDPDIAKRYYEMAKTIN